MPLSKDQIHRIAKDHELQVKIASSVHSSTGAVTDNAIARWDTTSGALLQNSVVILDDTGVMTGSTWQGTTIGLAYGGTNANLSATGGANQVLMQTSVGGNITVGQLAASDLSNGTTGSNSVVLGTSPTIATPTITTSATVPLVIGGTGTTSTLTLKTTTGVGTTNADMIFQVGNNGATEAMRILNSGNIGIGVTSPHYTLEVSSTIGLTQGSTWRKALTPTYFGYSASYRVLMLGSASSTYNVDDGAVTISLGHDPSSNTDGTFNGNGSEVILRNVMKFITPNAGNTSWNINHLTFNNTNIGIGTNTFGTNAQVTLAIANGTAPTTSPTDAIQLWSADRDSIAGKASLHIRTEDGTSHVIGDRVGIKTLNPTYSFGVVPNTGVEVGIDSDSVGGFTGTVSNHNFSLITNNAHSFLVKVGWQVGIGLGTATDIPTSALLELRSTTGALLLPRMTTTQRDALTATNGMMIYNTTTSKFQGYAGGSWVDFH